MALFLPPLFVNRIKKILPANEVESFLNQCQEGLTPSLRINLLKISLQQFQEIFSFCPFDNPVPWIEYGFFISKKSSFTKTPFYHAGLFYIQEASSMLPPLLLDPKPGEKVLDVCASPGSKTTQMITMMQNQGLLIANEIRQDRIGRLVENIVRWGAKNTVVTNQASFCFTPLEEFFDKILVDAPCSGEGMFKKDPQALALWSLKNIEFCAATQKQILRDVIPALKVGGTLVYSTCTFAPEENEEIINWILKTYPNSFELETLPYGEPALLKFEDKTYLKEVQKAKRIWPHKLQTEGFFVAKLIKTKPTLNLVKKTIKPLRKPYIQKPNLNLMKSFLKQFSLKNIEEVFQIGYRLYSWGNLSKKDLENLLHHLKPVYLGVHLGNEKVKRIEPEHPFALSLLPHEIKNMPFIELDLEQTINYLRGQEISLNQNNQKGFCVVCYQGFALGLGKISENKLKNLFPKGQRNKL